MFDAYILTGVGVRPSGDVSRGVHTGDARLKILIDDNTAIEPKPRLLGKSQPWSNSDACNHDIGLDCFTRLQANGFAVDSNRLILKVEHNTVLLVE
jgi:hypothetical protein